MAGQQRPVFDPETFLSKATDGMAVRKYRKNDIIFAQGDRADAVFYIREGRVKLTAVSAAGKEATFAVLGPTQFFGEGCITSQSVRMATATAVTVCLIARVDEVIMVRVIHKEPVFAEMFIAYLLSRNIRLEEDLVDQLFNSSEKRLARILLLLANFGKRGRSEALIPKISQETLAEMVGTTRSRVSFFMNKFRKLGLIDYDGGLEVHSSLLKLVLHDSFEKDQSLP
jgi:CRP/FNR family cyclic AMP-dependent transcriptional regulator